MAITFEEVTEAFIKQIIRATEAEKEVKELRALNGKLNEALSTYIKSDQAARKPDKHLDKDKE